MIGTRTRFTVSVRGTGTPRRAGPSGVWWHLGVGARSPWHRCWTVACGSCCVDDGGPARQAWSGTPSLELLAVLLRSHAALPLAFNAYAHATLDARTHLPRRRRNVSAITIQLLQVHNNVVSIVLSPSTCHTVQFLLQPPQLLKFCFGFLAKHALTLHTTRYLFASL